MSKVYYAGSLFNEDERSFNIKLAYELEKEGFEVFLPQRAGLDKQSNLIYQIMQME